jgi:hypothetical protein
MWMSVQVTTSIYRDQGTDATDEEREEKAQPIQIEGKGNPQIRDPRIRDDHRSPRGDRSKKAGEIQGEPSGEERKKPAGGPARQPDDPRRGNGQRKSRKDRCDHGRMPREL